MTAKEAWGWVVSYLPRSTAGRVTVGVVGAIGVAYVIAGIATVAAPDSTYCQRYSDIDGSVLETPICTTSSGPNYVSYLTSQLLAIAVFLLVIGVIALIVRSVVRSRGRVRTIHREGAAWQRPADEPQFGDGQQDQRVENPWAG